MLLGQSYLSEGVETAVTVIPLLESQIPLSHLNATMAKAEE